MAPKTGKYEKTITGRKKTAPFVLVPVWFFLVEFFGYLYLSGKAAPWPLAFGALWACTFSGGLRLLPPKAARILYGILGFGCLVYAIGQTGYYRLFSEMMWLSEFRYASEGADYLEVLQTYPLGWFLWSFALILGWLLLVWKFPRYTLRPAIQAASLLLAVLAVLGALRLPQRVFEADEDIRYAGSDYGRAQSAEAAYENMFNPHRLYQVCGLCQTALKDVYTHVIYPLTPGYASQREAERREIDTYFAGQDKPTRNEMTGLLAEKNVVVVLMESMDDWMLGEHTPTINRLMAEGIQFTNFYTPPYGGIRTFNTEFCINTGSYLSSQGGYAFDYVTNTFDHSLANVLGREGYSAKVFHYNTPSFYSRNVFSQALGYEEYVCYADYLTGVDEKTKRKLLYDDSLLFTNPELRQEFFREEEKTFNFVITRSAHLSYKYNEVLSHWALKKYPEYKGMTGSEETDCALVKARLVDDFFQMLLMALEDAGKLEDTVIIGVTDHYTYGYKNVPVLLELSEVENTLLLEKTPCFIWSADLEPVTVEKTLHTADLLPTILNLMGIEAEYDYIGNDAFDERYEGFVPFSNGSWISDDAYYEASSRSYGGPERSKQFRQEMAGKVLTFTRINNLILESNYYG